MKESDSVAVKVVDKIDVSTSAIINNTLRKDATTITFGKIGNNKLQAYNTFININTTCLQNL